MTALKIGVTFVFGSIIDGYAYFYGFDYCTVVADTVDNVVVAAADVNTCTGASLAQ